MYIYVLTVPDVSKAFKQPRNQETKKPRNQEAKKPTNAYQDTKICIPIYQELQPNYQELLIPTSDYQDPP